VDEPAFGGIGLGARTIFDVSSWTSGIAGAVMSAFTFTVAGGIGVVTSRSERENKWLTINQNHESMQ